MIADRIKSLREQQNMTQSDLAKQLGITSKEYEIRPMHFNKCTGLVL